jgi:hypothetical protein
MNVPPALILALLPLAACTAPVDRSDEIEAPAARVVGAAESCITTNQIRQTKVHDDYTIDFEMTGGRIYRNTLPIRCGSLGFEERFAYETSVGRLCSTDTITVLQADGRRGATCGLGQFVPIELVDNSGG